MKKCFKILGKIIIYPFRLFLEVLVLVLALLLFIPFKIVFPTKIIGRKNLRQVKGGKIVASNHFSNFDAPLLLVFFFPITWTRKFLAKVELAKNKFFGYILKCFGALYIDRNKLDMKAMKESTKELQRGKTLIMFPEGTRNKANSEDTQAVKGGVVFFAYRADATIVPLTILHKPKPFRRNKIIISEGYKIDKALKYNQDKEVERLSNVYKEVREKYINDKGE